MLLQIQLYISKDYNCPRCQSWQLTKFRRWHRL